MAKKTGFWMILVLLLGFAFWNGCAGENAVSESLPEGNYPGLDAETERRMKEDFASLHEDTQITADVISFLYYFGNYNGYEVIGVQWIMWYHHGYGRGLNELNVAGFVFELLNDATTILVWKQDENTESVPFGRFYQAQEAYELGFLTYDDVKTMYELNSTNFFPTE